MVMQVRCPKCRAKLSAAVDIAGKVVRCQSCKEKFRVPTEAAAAPVMVPAKPTAAAAEPETLNDTFADLKADSKPPSTPATASDSPFAFHDPNGPLIEVKKPAAKGSSHRKSTTPPVDEPTPHPNNQLAADAAADPFAFQDPNGPVVSVGNTRSKAALGKRSKPGLKDDAAEPPKKKSPLLLILGLVGLSLLVLVGGGIAVVVFVVLPQVQESVQKSLNTAPSVAAVPPAELPRPVDEGELKEKAPADKQRKSADAGPDAKKAATAPVARAAASAPAPPVARFNLTPPADPKLVVAPRQKLTLPVPLDALRGMKVAGTNPTYAFVVRVKDAGFQGFGGKDAVERFALNGSPAGECVVDSERTTWPRAFDVTGNGQLALIEGPAGKLTVYDFGDKQKVWDGLDVSKDRKGLRSAVFLTPDVIAVVDAAGTVDLWSVKEKKLSAAGQPLKAMPSAVVLGKLKDKPVLAAGSSVYVLAGPTRDDAPHFDLPVPDAEPLAVAADVADKRVAVLARLPKASPKHAVFLGAAEKGKQPGTLVLPDSLGTPDGLSWSSDSTLVVSYEGGKAAVIANSGTLEVLAYMKGKGAAVHLPANQSGSHWYAVPDDKDAMKTQLLAVELPLDEGAGVVADARDKKQPVYLLARPDGLAK